MRNFARRKHIRTINMSALRLRPQLLPLVLTCLFAVASCDAYDSGTAGSGAASQLVRNATGLTYNGRQYVDLGLPSGVYWCETNVGAETAADTGAFVAWGETAEKDTFLLSNYTWEERGYGTDLRSVHDAASQTCGYIAETPSHAHFAELCDSSLCTWTWTERVNSHGENVVGYEVTSRTNGNSIFLPAVGYKASRLLLAYGIYGCYWAKTFIEKASCSSALLFTEEKILSYYEFFRSDGLPVRAVIATRDWLSEEE